MKAPFVYDTEADISRLQLILDLPRDTPIHLTIAIYPLPEELKRLDNITYLHVKSGKYIPEIRDQFMDIICGLRNLETLIIERRIPGGIIPNEFYELRNLKHLTIHNTWFSRGALTEDIRNFSKLESLEIANGLHRGKIPDAIGELKHLKRLIVRDTNTYLEGNSDIAVPDTIWNLTNLREIRIGPGYPEESLNVDRIIELSNLEVFEFLLPVKVIPDAFWQLPNLREVHVHAREQTIVPSLADTKLISLDLHMKLSSLPDLPKTLEKLGISSNASELPSLKNTVIRDLSLYGQNLNAIPDLPATLETLHLDSLTLKTLPELPPLNRLVINSCYNLEELPPLPETLRSLQIGYCRKLSSLSEGLRLQHLWLSHCKSLSFLPPNLVVDTLIIDFCDKLDELPDDLVVLSKIQLTGLHLTKMPKFPSSVKVWIHDEY